MLLDFWFGFFVLAILRLNRRNTPFALSVTALLWVIASVCRGASQTEVFLIWLSSAAWVTTLAGFANHKTRLLFLPVLLPLMLTDSGPIGLLTGIALNLTRPQRRLRQPKENYGIYRRSMRDRGTR